MQIDREMNILLPNEWEEEKKTVKKKQIISTNTK